ncbi:MAG TPA: hypothetical protein VD788_06545 [Candidatus Polarisedimenticolaceae bacterium]|nr:hypothetical protein [Candidatus Polarisedimenticolaceae bacterium]
MAGKAPTLWIVVALIAAGPSWAQTVSWNLVDAGVWQIDPDSADRDEGWFAGGSFELGRKTRFHVLGEYGDFGDFGLWQLGGGWHGLLGDRADLFADLSFSDADTEDGFKLRFGVRWSVLARLELNGNVGWTDLDFNENESLAVNGIWSFHKRIGVGAGYEAGSEFNLVRAFVRFRFGSQE